jgi:hypothetical protein
VKHFFVDKNVHKVFRNEKQDFEYNLGIYMENGRIEIIDSPDSSDTANWDKALNNYAAKGKLIQIVSD